MNLKFIVYFQQKMRMPSVIPQLSVKQHYSAEIIIVGAVKRTSGMGSSVKKVRVIYSRPNKMSGTLTRVKL